MRQFHKASLAETRRNTAGQDMQLSQSSLLCAGHATVLTRNLDTAAGKPMSSMHGPDSRSGYVLSEHLAFVQAKVLLKSVSALPCSLHQMGCR
jgi:hypothetical protein